MWTPEQLAALAAGVDIETVKAMVAPVDTSASTTTATSAADLEAANTALAEASATNATLTAANATLTEANATLTEANAGLTASNEELTAKVAELEAAAAVSAGQVEAMTGAVMATIKNRAIVLGAEAPDSYESTATMMAAYADLDAKFKDKFKGGRHSLPTNKSKDTDAQAKGFDSATLAAMRDIKVPK